MTWTSLEIWKIANFSSQQVHRSIADRNWKQIDILNNFIVVVCLDSTERRISLHLWFLVSMLWLGRRPKQAPQYIIHADHWGAQEFGSCSNSMRCVMTSKCHEFSTHRAKWLNFSLHLSAVVPLKRQILRVSFNNFTRCVCRELKRAFVISWIFCYEICQEAVKYDERWSENLIVGRLYCRWAWIASNFSSN